MGAERSRKHDLQAVRAARDIIPRLGVGLAGVGMVEAGDDPPRTARPQRAGAGAWWIDRLDPDAVGGHGGQRFDARPFQRGFGGFPPVGLNPGRKTSRIRAQRRLSSDELRQAGN